MRKNNIHGDNKAEFLTEGNTIIVYKINAILWAMIPVENNRLVLIFLERKAISMEEDRIPTLAIDSSNPN